MDEPRKPHGFSTDSTDETTADSPLVSESQGAPGYDPSARLEYLQTVLPPKKNRRWLKWLIGLAVLALAAFGVFQLFAGQAAAPVKTTTVTDDKPPVQTGPVPITTQDYESEAFNLNLVYPDTWAVDDKSADKLALTSPKMRLKTAAGQEVTGKVSVVITPRGKNLEGFDQGNGTAVRDSQKIKYKNPTPEQRAETYLTFVRFADTAASGLDTIIITGDFGYLDGQAVPQIDMSKLGLVIQTTFQQCGQSDCTTLTPMVVNADAWNDPAIQKPILTLLESLSVN